VVLTFLVVKVGLVDRQHDWLRYTSPPGQVRGVEHSLVDESISFGNTIQLLGYDLPKTKVRAGDTLPLTLYWRATVPVVDNYQVFAHLTRPATHIWGQSDNLNPGEIPTQRWPLDKYIRDEHELNILTGTPPGDYQLTIGLYTLAGGARVPVFGTDGVFLGDTFALETPVNVTATGRAPDEGALGLTEQLGVGINDQITLVGLSVPDRQIELPGFVHLALLWRADVDQPDDIVVRVQLLDSSGGIVDEIATAPVDGRYPASVWSEGEIVRDQYALWLPADFAPGLYGLRVSIDGGDGWVSLGQIDVLER
jgi:hypothetical protein